MENGSKRGLQEEAWVSSRYLPAVDMREAAVWHRSNAFKANGSEHFDELKFHVRTKIRNIHPVGSRLLTFSSSEYCDVHSLINSANKQEKMRDLQGTVQKKHRRPICGVET